jgi:serine/threonine protein kinase
MDKPANAPFGQYRLLAELGRGTTGVVYKAQDSLFPRLVALKTIPPVAGADMRLQVARLHREAL